MIGFIIDAASDFDLSRLVKNVIINILWHGL